MPFTESTIRVDEVLSGPDVKTFVVSQLGNDRAHAENLPNPLSTDETYLLYVNELYPATPGTKYNVLASYVLDRDSGNLTLDIDENLHDIPAATTLTEASRLASGEE